MFFFLGGKWCCRFFFLTIVVPAEHFIYDRDQGHQMSAYLQESDIQEEDENMEQVIVIV